MSDAVAMIARCGERQNVALPDPSVAWLQTCGLVPSVETPAPGVMRWSITHDPATWPAAQPAEGVS